LEKTIALVKKVELLDTYDYVDIVKLNDMGWQIKSTKANTPVTWKRAKISAEKKKLIEASMNDQALCQILGNAVIDFCNKNVQECIIKYNLREVGYCRLVVYPDNSALYFERKLCTSDNPIIFDPNDFSWHWSSQKETKKKEQLPALHGIHKKTNKKWWSWHGQSENQLHFSGESLWWPAINTPHLEGEFIISEKDHAIAFKLPTSTVSLEDLVVFLNSK
ncbi:MAG TPA: hypothetical protein VFF04_03200, partial [Candidatus Babeliales bacterium]|nr:hypothetical protein [Candidatus Babeliales bacterium]